MSDWVVVRGSRRSRSTFGDRDICYARTNTVWLYLLFLPFQLADVFNWYTIPGTAVAAFFYLGFIAAGDEIEQPFGYDENDLDLDLFCREVVQVDLHTLTTTPFPNAPPGSHHGDIEINEASTVVDVSLGTHHV
ncbi:Bestrophin, RFP-TM, chloride channel-domain-containing protein [Gautieria morchelliformis]|nr:Bestrophin, RFP-TM, chloride channel-domain-containing protein [Gautieria morchelliformis]